MTAKKRTWIFDFDGTLSNLTQHRQKAVLNPHCRTMLRQLAATDNQLVAIVSSRALDDLTRLVKVPGVILAGGSGMEILRPNGRRAIPQKNLRLKVERTRARFLPNLHTEIGQLPGVDIEDKYWSVAVHVRHATVARKRQIWQALPALTKKHRLRYFRGPEAADIPFVSGLSKVIGLRSLARLYPKVVSPRRLTFIGDDQNDLQAMKWVKERGGDCMIVGKAIKLAGAKRLASPEALAREMLKRIDTLRKTKGAISQ